MKQIKKVVRKVAVRQLVDRGRRKLAFDFAQEVSTALLPQNELVEAMVVPAGGVNLVTCVVKLKIAMSSNWTMVSPANSVGQL